MNIIREYSATRGNKKSYIVNTEDGPVVAYDIDTSGNLGWTVLNEDGSISYPNNDKVPKYLDNLVAQAYSEMAEVREELGETASFTDWLITQRDRKDSVGELARGAESDRAWPTKGRSYESFTSYLGFGVQSEGLQEALETAWEQYELSLVEESTEDLE